VLFSIGMIEVKEYQPMISNAEKADADNTHPPSE
jgi:hypothetical protein